MSSANHRASLLEVEFARERKLLCAQIEKMQRRLIDVEANDLIRSFKKNSQESERFSKKTNSLQDELESVKHQLSSRVESLNIEKMEEINLLKNQISELNSAALETETELKNQVEELKLSFGVKIKELENRENEISRLKHKCRKLKKSIKQVEGENELLKTEQQALMTPFFSQDQNPECTQKMNEVDILNTRIEQLERELEKTSVRQKKLKCRKVKLVGRVEALEKDRGVLDEELQSVKDKLDEEKRKYSASIEENKELFNTITSLKVTIGSFEETDRQQKQEIAELKRTIKKNKPKGEDSNSQKRKISPSADVECTPPKKKAKYSEIVVTFSGIKDSNIHKTAERKLKDIVKRLNGKIVDEIGPNVTHLVSPPSCRTLKTLAGSLRSVWIVRPSWLVESYKAREFLPEEKFGSRFMHSPFEGKSFFLAPGFRRDETRAKVCVQLLTEHGRGRIENSHEAADFVVVSSSDTTSHFVRPCLTWIQLVDMIPSRNSAGSKEK